jgi:hypothetical protein
MTSRQFVAVALRLFAIWMGMAAVQSILYIFVDTPGGNRVPYFAYAVLYAAVAAVLWTFPMKIAGHILSAASGDSPTNVTPRGLVHAAIIAAGLVLLVQTLPRFLDTVPFILVNLEPQYSDPTSRTLALLNLAIPALQIVLALLMVLRAPSLARAIQPRELERRESGDL